MHGLKYDMLFIHEGNLHGLLNAWGGVRLRVGVRVDETEHALVTWMKHYVRGDGLYA